MPGKDGTGPLGKGPRSGKGCVIDKNGKGIRQGRGQGNAGGQGRGLGNVNKKGRGRGRGIRGDNTGSPMNSNNK